MSHEFTVYDTSTGRPLRTMEVFRESEIALNVREGEGFVLGTFTDATHYVRDGAALEIPACPYAAGVFDFAAAAWVDAETERLAEKRASARFAVNMWAADRRARVITLTPGQSDIYEMKRAEAAAFIADAEPDPADYPAIYAEVGITGTNAEEVAQVFLNLNAVSREAVLAIEADRIATLEAVRNADLAGVEAILESLK